jgi:hypothetical protein
LVTPSAIGQFHTATGGSRKDSFFVIPKEYFFTQRSHARTCVLTYGKNNRSVEELPFMVQTFGKATIKTMPADLCRRSEYDAWRKAQPLDDADAARLDSLADEHEDIPSADNSDRNAADLSSGCMLQSRAIFWHCSSKKRRRATSETCKTSGQ